MAVLGLSCNDHPLGRQGSEQNGAGPSLTPATTPAGDGDGDADDVTPATPATGAGGATGSGGATGASTGAGNTGGGGGDMETCEDEARPGASYPRPPLCPGVGSGGVGGAGGSNGACPTSPAVTADLHGVYSLGARDVWAVGAVGTILHYDGCWRVESSPTTAPTILHFDGTSWTESSDPNTMGISDLGGSGANDVWAVGLAGKRLHFDGTAWTLN